MKTNENDYINIAKLIERAVNKVSPEILIEQQDKYNDNNITSQGGLTKLEYFSCNILQGLLSNANSYKPYEVDIVESVKIAKLLVKELNKEHEQDND